MKKSIIGIFSQWKWLFSSFFGVIDLTLHLDCTIVCIKDPISVKCDYLPEFTASRELFLVHPCPLLWRQRKHVPNYGADIKEMLNKRERTKLLVHRVPIVFIHVFENTNFIFVEEIRREILIWYTFSWYRLKELLNEYACVIINRTLFQNHKLSKNKNNKKCLSYVVS